MSLAQDLRVIWEFENRHRKKAILLALEKQFYEQAKFLQSLSQSVLDCANSFLEFANIMREGGAGENRIRRTKRSKTTAHISKREV